MSAPDPKTKWQNLRRMGWGAFFVCVALTIKIVWDGDLGKHLPELLIFWGGIITLYGGASTARDGWGKQ